MSFLPTNYLYFITSYHYGKSQIEYFLMAHLRISLRSESRNHFFNQWSSILWIFGWMVLVSSGLTHFTTPIGQNTRQLRLRSPLRRGLNEGGEAGACQLFRFAVKSRSLVADQKDRVVSTYGWERWPFLLIVLHAPLVQLPKHDRTRSCLML